MLQVGPRPTGGGHVSVSRYAVLDAEGHGKGDLCCSASAAPVRAGGSLGLPERGTVECLWASLGTQAVVTGIVDGWTGVPNLCDMS